MNIYIDSRQFTPITDRDEARALFSRGVEYVEIEPHSYCNRRCGYCPNATHDRTSESKRMDEAVFNRIITDLSAIDYAHIISFSGYSEPLSDESILDKVAAARQALPKATLTIHSNGDYLTREYFDRLVAAGLNCLSISIHLQPGEAYLDSKVIRRVEQMSDKLGIKPVNKTYVYGEKVEFVFPHDTMFVKMFHADLDVHGIDRGGLITQVESHRKVRTAPCFSPFSFFVVHYNGNIMPCCHVVGDAEEHQPYVVGKLLDFPSIYQAYTSPAMTGWRRALVNRRAKAAPCTHCSVNDDMDNPVGGNPQLMEQIAGFCERHGLA